VTVLFDREQRGILRRMTLAALVTAATFAGGRLLPDPSCPAASVSHTPHVAICSC